MVRFLLLALQRGMAFSSIPPQSPSVLTLCRPRVSLQPTCSCALGGAVTYSSAQESSTDKESHPCTPPPPSLSPARALAGYLSVRVSWSSGQSLPLRGLNEQEESKERQRALS
ncbi:hypothetical protein SRHO_G00094710 [Serrasalmus rhombeus]